MRYFMHNFPLRKWTYADNSYNLNLFQIPSRMWEFVECQQYVPIAVEYQKIIDAHFTFGHS